MGDQIQHQRGSEIAHSLPKSPTDLDRNISDIHDEQLSEAYFTSRPQSVSSIFTAPLLERSRPLSQSPPLPTVAPSKGSNGTTSTNTEPRKHVIDDRRWIAWWYCFPHLVPLSIAIVILALNGAGAYWQDVGKPNQNFIIQALQYVARTHELMMNASISAIVIYRLRADLTTSKGVPFGFLGAGFQLNDPTFMFSKEFWGGATSRTRSNGLSRYFPYGFLLVLGFSLTALGGPSSAVLMIPRLDWWYLPKQNAFGKFDHRLYWNGTYSDLWPSNITPDIYANQTATCAIDPVNNPNCFFSAFGIILPWINEHEMENLEPNITVPQLGQVVRYLTSEGGTREKSSWTATSTVPYQIARDLGEYWEWLMWNATLLASFDRPLLQISFKHERSKIKKPLVQAQCKSYYNPDFEMDTFEFPHNELRTPPLDEHMNAPWILPNDFVKGLIGNDTAIGNFTDKSHPYVLFDWYDTANNFSTTGAPSLGAVAIYSAHPWFNPKTYGIKNSTHYTCLVTCSFDARWAPVEIFLDPKVDMSIRQDTPSPKDIILGPSKANPKELIQMKMSLEWAQLLNLKASSLIDPSASTTEQLLEALGGQDWVDWWDIYPEAERDSPWIMATVDWRLSTVLGLYLTEALARAYVHQNKSSAVYRDGPTPELSFARRLDDLVDPNWLEGWDNHTLAWVHRTDLRWAPSMPSFDVWAPEHGYTEMRVEFKRYGYGYGLGGAPVKLATIALVVYSLLVTGYIVSVLLSGRTFKSWSKMSELLGLAWNSAPAAGLRNTSAGINKCATSRQVVWIREEEDNQLCLVLMDHRDRAVEEKVSSWKLRTGTKYG